MDKIVSHLQSLITNWRRTNKDVARTTNELGRAEMDRILATYSLGHYLCPDDMVIGGVATVFDGEIAIDVTLMGYHTYRIETRKLVQPEAAPSTESLH